MFLLAMIFCCFGPGFMIRVCRLYVCFSRAVFFVTGRAVLRVGAGCEGRPGRMCLGFIFCGLINGTFVILSMLGNVRYAISYYLRL